MKKRHIARATTFCTLALCLGAGVTSCTADESAADTPQVEGLWEYTGLSTSDGSERPLTGVFLFKNGIFVQQAIFDGEPFEEQAAMAHAGPYAPAGESVHLLAEQTISISSQQEHPLSFRRNTEHDVSVERSGNDLTLVFGSGTVQEFRLIGPGDGEVYALRDGALAFVDRWFVLVYGNESGAVTGYGTFEKGGDALKLGVIRWAEADGSGTSYHRDIAMDATFDGKEFTLEDGRAFPVIR
jgi:hypothetical protein